jgi:hypothetical protein
MAEQIDCMILLTDLQCFIPITSYVGLVKYNKLKIEQYEHFRKGSYSNRYYIAGPNGRILLSIPLLHSGRERTAFKDLKICNLDRWQLLHWRTLTSAYRRSPWFEFYEDDLHVMYDRKFEYLMDWNLAAFELVNGWLGWSWEITYTEEYQKVYTDPKIMDARHLVWPQKDTAALSEDTFRYHQVFEDRTGFLPGLSILDLVFCEGKRAVSLLSENSKGS